MNEIKLPADVFLNKEMTDAIRYLNLNSPLEVERILICIKGSLNIERDKEIILKLSCVGYNIEKIKEIIKILNS